MCMQLVPTVLEYAGQKVRGGADLFESDTPTPISITKKFFKGLKVTISNLIIILNLRAIFAFNA